MSRIADLISSLCPDGVRMESLGVLCEFGKGNWIKAELLQPGKFPVVTSSRVISHFHNEANRPGQTVVVASSGAYAGFVSYWEQPFWLSNAFSVDPKPDSELLPKFLFHCLKNLQDRVHDLASTGGVPNIYGNDLESIRIPLPPLEVQREVVRILETFIDLEAELEAELDARKSQYEHYRKSLLTFPEGIRLVPMDELFDIRIGYTPSKSNLEYWEGGTIPWFRLEDIRLNGNVLLDSLSKVSQKAVKGGLFPKDSIIVSTSATIGEHAFIRVPFIANQRFTCLSLKPTFSTLVSMEYINQYFYLVDEWCRDNTTMSSFASVEMSKFRNYMVPLPELNQQVEIAELLDNFHSVISVPRGTLPSEILARKKQFEHYRNQLLNFKALVK
jgi:type I restriction enzyme S subunit